MGTWLGFRRRSRGVSSRTLLRIPCSHPATDLVAGSYAVRFCHALGHASCAASLDASDVCRDRSALTRTVESSSLFRELRPGLDTIRIAIPRLQAVFRTIVVGGFPSK